MKKKKVVCIGEALVDRIKNKSNEEFTDFLGGAPANVACALKKLQIDSAFIGCLGSDKDGQKFIEKFEQLKIDIQFLQIVKNSPTRVVKVNRNNFGDRYFSGFDKVSGTVFADELLDITLLEKHRKSLEELFSQTKFLVTGTIVLSSLISKKSIYFLLNLARKFDVKIVIDLNWREVFWDYSTFSSQIRKEDRVELIKDFLNFADILKLAKEEAIIFFQNHNPIEISKKLARNPDVIITDGGRPICWYINSFSGTSEVLNSDNIIDTTGAGDAFLAGFISKLISSTNSLKEIEIKDCIKFASICGLLTCLGEGAIEQQPDYKSVNEFLGSKIL